MKEYMFNGFNISKPKSKKNNSLNWSKVFKVSITFLILLLIIAFCIVYQNHETSRAFFDKYLFRKYSTENNLPNIQLDSYSSYNFYAYNNNILTLNKNTLSFYNKYGNKEHDITIEVTNPIFESNGDYLCIAEKNGQKVYLISNRNIIWQKTLEGNISDISINKNGFLAISLSGTAYKTIVELISPEGTELFNTYHSSAYAIDTSISDDSKYLAIAEANLSGALIQSNIKIVSIESAIQNSADSIVYNYISPSNDLVIDINYLNKDILACKFDNSIGFIKKNEIIEVSDFDINNILFADINNSIIQIVKSSSDILNTTFEFQSITSNNDNANKYTIDGEPKSIQVYGNITALNFGSEVLFINNNGWLVKQYKSSQEIKDIVFSNNIAAIVYSNKLEIISL